MKTHLVRQGECLFSIAEDHGHHWKTLWEDGANARLKEERKSPYILLPGDEVAVPDLRPREESKAAEQAHRFRRKGVPATLKLRLLSNGEPRKEVAWKANLGSGWEEGTTDGDGNLKIRLPPNSPAGLLRLEDGTEYRLLLRELDPLDTMTGVQARLNNLGYAAGPVDGIQGPLTTAAIRAFQEAYPPLDVDGIVGPKTRDKLKEVYGC
jgi:N-acetylmuramoyl-L-alanine amidase